jgi:hypothetical protein
MLVHGQPLAFQWPSKRRIPWLLVALALMFTSAYSITRWVGAVGAISGWVGLPQYAASSRMLQMEVQWWKALALALPFVAALVLGLGAQGSTGPDGSSMQGYPGESHSWTLPFQRYLGRLVVSVLGTFGFTLCMFLLGFLLYKLGIHTG